MRFATVSLAVNIHRIILELLIRKTIIQPNNKLKNVSGNIYDYVCSFFFYLKLYCFGCMIISLYNYSLFIIQIILHFMSDGTTHRSSLIVLPPSALNRATIMPKLYVGSGGCHGTNLNINVHTLIHKICIM